MRKGLEIQHKIIYDSKIHLEKYRLNVNLTSKFHGRSVNTDRGTLKALIFFGQMYKPLPQPYLLGFRALM